MRKPAKDKKKQPKRRVITEEMDEEEKEALLKAQAAEDEEYMTKIEYSPSLQKCQDYLCKALSTIVETTNKFQILEKDLMQNLPQNKEEKKANFPITEDFPWIVDAKQKIIAMTDVNTIGPMALLADYKKYEFILNTDAK